MVIVISNETPVEQEHKIINALFDEGLGIFHLRKPDISRKDLNQLLIKIDKWHHSKIALHQHHELADYFGTNRLHYTEKDRILYEHSLRNSDMSAFTLSTSIHQLASYISLPLAFEYCFLSPVFNSISKPEYHSLLTPGFRLPLKTQTKLIALGGISIATIPEVKKFDFDGIAVLGSIWRAPETAVLNFKKIQLEWNK
jgi:thiamine-phosphate pyrophosphorylase